MTQIDTDEEAASGQLALPNRDGGAAEPDPGAFHTKVEFSAAWAGLPGEEFGSAGSGSPKGSQGAVG